VISLLDFGIPRDAMAFGASEAGALYGGYAQKGFGVFILDGSPFPLGSTATYEHIEIPRSLWERWGSPDAKGLKTLWIKKQSNPKQINISDNQQPSGDKRELFLEIRNLKCACGNMLDVENASLHLDRSEVVVILGRNGASKTTLLKAVAGAVKPISGSIIYIGC
jgi:ABC-type multidrug transport system fused ATPase/permease subunit